jgi:flagellar P-ring protein precursor FlgI
MAKYESRNSACVLVTAQLPSYANPGEKMDLQVASIGDARSLAGGLLIQTPLYGGDGQIYGVGQGLISTAQDKSSSGARSQKDNVALVTNGCLIERPLLPDLSVEKNGKAEIILILKEFSFINAQKISQAIKGRYPDQESAVLSGSQIRLTTSKENVNAILASIMELKVTIPDMARVVLDERSGVVVMGNQVRVSPVALSVTGLYQKEKKEGADTQDFYESSASKEKGKALFYIEKTSTIKEVIDKLNEMGASTKDVIAILKAINDSGSLHGELIVR